MRAFNCGSPMKRSVEELENLRARVLAGESLEALGKEYGLSPKTVRVYAYPSMIHRSQQARAEQEADAESAPEERGPGFLRWMAWRPWISCSACGLGANCSDPPAHRVAGAKVESPQFEYLKAWSEGNQAWLVGANQLGKTETLAYLLASILRGYVPVLDLTLKSPAAVWLVCPDKTQAEGACEDKMFIGRTCDGIPFIDGSEIEKRGGRGRGASIEPYILKNGSILWIRSTTNVAKMRGKFGMKQGKNPDQFGGAVLTAVAFDEEVPEAVYSECLPRVLAKGYPVFGAMTPNNGTRWFSRRVLRPALEKTRKIFVAQPSIWQNPYIPMDRKQEFAKNFDGVERAIRVEGEYHVLEGRPIFEAEQVRKLEQSIRPPIAVEEWT